MADYAVVVVKNARNFSGYVPDLPGCIATGSSSQQVVTRLKEVIETHLAGLREDGARIPPAQARVARVKVKVARVSRKSAARRAA